MNASFEELVLEKAKEAPPFRPTAHYDADGDCIEFIMTDESFYAERIDPLVTVYYGEDTKEIVGSLISGSSGPRPSAS